MFLFKPSNIFFSCLIPHHFPHLCTFLFWLLFSYPSPSFASFCPVLKKREERDREREREMYHNRHFQYHPCLHCHPHSYIRMVQHLIERCLLLHMSREQCVRALAVHASIRPLVTLTVWRELQKENKDFFHAYYFHVIPPRPLLESRSYIQRVPRILAKRRQYWK